MQYFNTVRLTARSAWSTLCVLDRQARRDWGKVSRAAVRVFQILTGKQAMQTYRAIWNLFVIACMVAIALSMTARDVIRSLNVEIDSCEAQPAELLSDPWEAELIEAEVEPAACCPLPLLLLPAAPAPIALLSAAQEAAAPARRTAKPKAAKAPAKSGRTRTKKAA